MPEMNPVVSSNVEAIGYDPDNRKLHVRFHSGTTYVYLDVAERVFHEFMEADSKGKYLNANVKGQYQYAKL